LTPAENWYLTHLSLLATGRLTRGWKALLTLDSRFASIIDLVALLVKFGASRLGRDKTAEFAGPTAGQAANPSLAWRDLSQLKPWAEVSTIWR
jgi:hypothetical protein